MPAVEYGRTSSRNDQTGRVDVSVPQISVFVENKKGRVAEVVKTLGRAGFSISGFSVADVSDYGIVRLLVERGDEAHRLLEEKGFTTVVNDVVAIALNNVPGALAAALGALAESGFDAEYMYLTADRSVVVKVDDVAAVERTLTARGFRLLQLASY